MENAAGIGTVTSEMVESRARELAAINGRPSSEPSEADYQQAKRELTGEPEMDPQEENSGLVLDSEAWDPVPGSSGRQAADCLGEDEDDEGRDARVPRCSKKASAKRSTIKCVRHPRRMRRATNQSHNLRARATVIPGADAGSSPCPLPWSSPCAPT